MKTLICILFLLFPLTASAQVVAHRGDAVALDYVDADLVNPAGPVASFQLCFDGATTGCVTATPSAAKFVDSPVAPVGQSSYKLLLPPSLPFGVHTVIAGACNAGGCGSTPPFSFNLQPALPPAPMRVRLKAGG